ncbi:hypothetical protein V6Z12_D01G191800 [Gossypium hirsutum]
MLHRITAGQTPPDLKSLTPCPTFLFPFSLNSKINFHLRHQSTSTDPPPILHGSTHFQNQRLERSYKRLLPLNFKVRGYRIKSICTQLGANLCY